MRKNILKKITIIVISMFAIWLLQGRVQAATMSISASKTSVNPGEKVTITVSSDCIGRVNIGSTGGSLSSSSVWVEGNSQSVTLTANSAGTITVTAQPVTLSSSTGEEVSVGAKSCSIKVANNSAGGSTSNNNQQPTNNNSNSAPQKSNIATLGNLGITPNDFKGFSPSKTSYSITVPNSVASISIYANKGQGGQSISGTGSKSLKEGANQFNVVVTAEDGKTTKTYTLSVTREKATTNDTNTASNNTIEEENVSKEQDDENEKDEEKEPNEETIGLSKLDISEFNLEPEFQKDIYEYIINMTGDATSLDINTAPLSATQKVEIIGNEDLQDGENFITILVSDEKGENTVTYQVTVNKNLGNEDNLDKEKEEKQKRQRTIVITVLVVIAIIIAVILIVRYIRYRRESEVCDNGYLYDNEENTYDDEKDNHVYEEHKRKTKSKGKRFK